MAKGQQRSNREQKKPKKDKPKVSAAASSSVGLSLEKAQSKGGFGKKK